ncbi:hypothetical protein SAMN04487988_10563 [Algoriphagus hitonicola]|uniref:Uncharacterized protein n=1 Tax=Algoriphagus hitonicola TaxID=435880 RepID=A0A1I2SW91_9BACT|nr:hypothetical protein SAMN04487988_10563 [Algoriphagus hitonicola]
MQSKSNFLIFNPWAEKILNPSPPKNQIFPVNHDLGHLTYGLILRIGLPLV